jgi:hypothetical protein
MAVDTCTIRRTESLLSEIRRFEQKGEAATKGLCRDKRKGYQVHKKVSSPASNDPGDARRNPGS